MMIFDIKKKEVVGKRLGRRCAQGPLRGRLGGPYGKHIYTRWRVLVPNRLRRKKKFPEKKTSKKQKLTIKRKPTKKREDDVPVVFFKLSSIAGSAIIVDGESAGPFLKIENHYLKVLRSILMLIPLEQ